MLTVAIVEDHPVFREALKQILTQTRMEIDAFEAASFDALKSHLQARPATDLILLDLEIPGAKGFSALAHLNYNFPNIRVVVISGHEDAGIIERAISLGADAFIPKSLPLKQLLAALETVLLGDRYVPPVTSPPSGNTELLDMSRRVADLSPQQRRVVMGMAQGRLNKQIAYELGITEGTVKNHVTSILRHLGLRRRTEVVAQIHQLMQVNAQSLIEVTENSSSVDP